jgi:hypothetical protein
MAAKPVAIFPDRESAAYAISQLQAFGFDAYCQAATPGEGVGEGEGQEERAATAVFVRQGSEMRDILAYRLALIARDCSEARARR